jgi:hypothetical protein
MAGALRPDLTALPAPKAPTIPAALLRSKHSSGLAPAEPNSQGLLASLSTIP